jgi:hypothetical protein
MNEQNASFIRAARGPLILITIGTLFAIDRFTQYRFSETWPILLIVVGVLGLLGGSRRNGSWRDGSWHNRQVGYQGPPPPPPPQPPPPPPYDSQGGRP